MENTLESPPWFQDAVNMFKESYADYLEEYCDVISETVQNNTFDFLRRLWKSQKNLPQPFVFAFSTWSPRIILDWPDVALGFYENGVFVSFASGDMVHKSFKFPEQENDLVSYVSPYLKRKWSNDIDLSNVEREIYDT